jgi:hypothetical protein
MMIIRLLERRQRYGVAILLFLLQTGSFLQPVKCCRQHLDIGWNAPSHPIRRTKQGIRTWIQSNTGKSGLSYCHDRSYPIQLIVLLRGGSSSPSSSSRLAPSIVPKPNDPSRSFTQQQHQRNTKLHVEKIQNQENQVDVKEIMDSFLTRDSRNSFIGKLS